MSYFECETVAWVDPYMLRAEHHFDADDDEQQQIKSKLQAMAERREKESAVLWTSNKAPKPQSMFHPIDCDTTYITGCSASNGTFACVTKNLQLHLFDQEGRVAPVSLKLQGSTPAPGGGRGPSLGGLPNLVTGASPSVVFIDAKDCVLKVLVDPLGCYVFVTFGSGACLMYHIRKGDKAPKPLRHDVVVPASVSGQATFPVESVGWDPHNEFETSTGDILLGSARGGCLVSCRCEPSGVAGMRKVFTFPQPFNRSPIHSIAMVLDSDDARRRTVLVAIEHRLFYFSGRGSIESMFDGFAGPETLTNYISLTAWPTGSPSMVRILQYNSKKHPEFPTAFSWQCGDFVVQGLVKSVADVLPNDLSGQEGDGGRPNASKKKKKSDSPSAPATPLKIVNAFETTEIIRKLLQFHSLECVAFSAVRGAAAPPPLPAGEKVVHVTQSMFHLAVMTTKRLYCLASTPLLPFDFSRASGCSLNNRLVVNCAVPSNESMKPKASDAAQFVIWDRRLIDKFYILSARDVLELDLVPQKGPLAALFVDCAKTARSVADAVSSVELTPQQKKQPTGGSSPAKQTSIAQLDQQVRVALGSSTQLSVADLFTCAHSLVTKKAARVRQATHMVQGDVLLRLRQNTDAAVSFAQCPRRGVDFAVSELSQLATTDALICFLNEKLKFMAEHRKGIEDGIIETTCLASWLVALLLDKCTQLTSRSSTVSNRSRTRRARRDESDTTPAALTAPGSFTLDAAKKLLSEVIGREKDFLPWEPMRQLLFSIGSPDQVQHLCDELGKHKELTEFLIIHERFYDALTVLTEKCADASYYRVWQRYSLLLIQHYPVRLIKKGWIEHGSELELDPLTLIPALSHYDRTRNETRSDAEGPANRLPTSSSQMLASDYEQVTEHVAITYLKHAIVAEGSCEPALHNLLLSELAQNGTDDELVRFIGDSEYVDKQYAMRVCLAHNRMLGCIHLYYRLGHVQQAVNLALRERQDGLAKDLIKRLDRNQEQLLAGEDVARLRQTLWTMVIKHVAPRQDGGPRNALLVAGESGGDVNVSHVLPELSDDVMICEFKTELLLNVQQFGMLMKAVREDITMANKDAEMLRSDLALERAKDVKCNASKKCDACAQIIANRAAMVFFRGCGHCFHSSCFSNRLQFFASLSRRGAGSAVRSEELECYLCSASSIRAIITAPTNIRLGLDSSASITI